MIRAILIFILLALVYQAVKVVFGSAVRAARKQDERSRLQGEEMVLDPECRTYVVKDRAVTRTVRGTRRHFCSEACWRRYEERSKG